MATRRMCKLRKARRVGSDASATCMNMRVAATFSSLSPPPTPCTPFVASPSLPLGGLFRFAAACPLARRTPMSASICSHCAQLNALNAFSSFTRSFTAACTVCASLLPAPTVESRRFGGLLLLSLLAYHRKVRRRVVPLASSSAGTSARARVRLRGRWEEMGGRWEGDGREMDGRWEGDGREMGGRWTRDGREMGGR